MPQNNRYSIYDLTGLTEYELADVLSKNPRSYMAVKGAVAEKHLQKILDKSKADRVIRDFRAGEGDFDKDFYVTLPNGREMTLECKTIEVLKTNNKRLAKEYLLFLVRQGYIGIDDIRQIIATDDACQKAKRQSLHDGFRNADELGNYLNSQSAVFVQAVRDGLPVELKTSGMPRYNFSENMLSYPSIEDADSQTFLRQFDSFPLSIDFQRTRNAATEESESEKNRLYRVGEIDAVAACLFTRTKRWEFIYATTEHFAIHNKYPDRYRNTLKITPEHWTTDLREVVDYFVL